MAQDRRSEADASSVPLAQLKAFIRDAPISIAMFDRDMTYLAASDRWMKDYGRGRTDFVGRNHYECRPDLPQGWKAVHQQGLAGNTQRKDEDLWIQADGTKQWLRWAVQPWRNEKGAIGGIVISTEDITDRKRAEEGLRESEQRYSAIFDASPYAIVLTRMPDHVVVGANAAFLNLLECRREEVLGKTRMELGIAGLASGAQVQEELVLRGSVRDFECTRTMKSGAQHVLALNIDRVSIGGQQHQLTTIKDTTELRRAEAKARLYEESKEIDALKNEFFANVSHEFRTPLTLILGPVEDALALPSKSLGREGLEAVHRSALRLLRLVNSLLDFSRIQAGRVQASFEPTDLAVLTTDLASAFRSLVERAGLELIIDCPPLPQPVYVDPSQWEKIVLNLLSNAFKFTFRGQIAVSLRSKDDHVELAVRDTGTGIPAHELDHIFERFHRVQGARSRSFEGTGIGLALVQELTSLHGGVVDVSSIEHQGSTFTVSIPFGTAHLPADQIVRGNGPTDGRRAAVSYVLEASQWLPGGEDAWSAATDAHAFPRPAQAAGALRPLTEAGSILVVDDNADMRSYLVRLLGTRYHVESVGDGDSALAAARAHPPDLVLTDVMMRGLDGFGVLRELRADPRTNTVPVILLSARAGEESMLEGLETGADDYIIKPFSARELLTRVRTHLEMARLRRGAAAVADHRSWLESILDLAPMPLLLLEPETARITFANRAADRMAGGYFPKNVPAERYHEAYDLRDTEGQRIPNEATPGVRAAWGERLDGVEVVWQTPAGTFSLLLFSDTLPAVHNHPATVVIAFLDITKLKKVEGDLKAAVLARDEFLSIASHELRTPLSVLVLQLAGIQKVLHELRIEPMKEKLVGKVDKAVKSTANLSKLIDALLDVSRITTGLFALDLEDVDLSEVVREVSDRFAEGVRKAGCTLHVHAPPAARGEWDRLRLEQVLANLLSNAVKYGRGGSIDVTLEVDADKARLSVRDEGIGISEADDPRIFGRFERAVPARHYGGLGLGLYITRQIVEAHGGQIHVTSAPGAGSTFTIDIPRYPAPGVLRSDGEPRVRP